MAKSTPDNAKLFTDIISIMCIVMDDVCNYEGPPSKEATKHAAELFNEIHTRCMAIDGTPAEATVNLLLKGAGE